MNEIHRCGSTWMYCDGNCTNCALNSEDGKERRMMEKFIRVSDINKDHAPVYTAEEIANSFRGVSTWVWNEGKWNCGHCGCTSRDRSEFCKYCGSLNGR